MPRKKSIGNAISVCLFIVAGCIGLLPGYVHAMGNLPFDSQIQYIEFSAVDVDDSPTWTFAGGTPRVPSQCTSDSYSINAQLFTNTGATSTNNLILNYYYRGQSGYDSMGFSTSYNLANQYGSTPNGTYEVEFIEDCYFSGDYQQQTSPRYQFTITNNNLTDFVPVPSVSGITLVTPTEATHPMNPLHFSGVYSNLDTFDKIVFEINQTDAGVQLMRQHDIPLINQADVSYSYYEILPYQGNYTARAKLYDSVNGTSTAWTSSLSFALGTTTVATSSFPNAPMTIGDCSTFDIACYIKQAVMWLVVPTDDSITQFKSLTLEHSKPFSYAYDVPVLYDELFSGGATSTAVAVSVKGFGNGSSTITFLSEDMLEAIPYSSTIKTILGWIMYLLMADLVFIMIRRVFSSNHH